MSLGGLTCIMIFYLHFLAFVLEPDFQDLDVVLLEQLSDVVLPESDGIVADVDLMGRPKCFN